MTADGGKSAFEDLKRMVALSKSLIEFVANDTGVSPETVFKVMSSIGRSVHRSAGTAAAAVYFEKPLAQVTAAEARAVLEQVAGEGDNPDRVWSAWRAALRQALFLLLPRTEVAAARPATQHRSTVSGASSSASRRGASPG